MTSDATWRLQISFKTPAGSLLNLRGETGAEVEQQLMWLADHTGVIASAEQVIAAGGAVAASVPLAPPAQQSEVRPNGIPAGHDYGPGAQQQAAPQAPPNYQPQQQGGWGQPPAQQPNNVVPMQQPAQGGQQPGPVCKHGQPAKYVPGGVSGKTGRPYRAFWACAMDRAQQCDFRADG